MPSSSDLAIDIRAIFHCDRCAANATPEEEVLLWVEEDHLWRWVMWSEGSGGPKVWEWHENTEDWHVAEASLIRKYQLGNYGQVSCSRCWNEWNWFVKKGERKYMLDSECESLLQKFGALNVLINEVEADAPFFCRLCLLSFSRCNLKPHLSRHLNANSVHFQHGFTQTNSITSVEMWVQTQSEATDESNMLWEFEGNHSQWQPFADDVQRELEEGYLQAQTGGEPRVVIFTNNYRYIVDFEEMTQRNPTTNTTRQVRRKNVLEVKVGDLENVILNLQQEQQDLQEAVQALTETNRDMARRLRENDTVRVEHHSAQMSMLEMWKTERQLLNFHTRPIASTDLFFRSCETLLRQAVPQTHIGQCSWMRGVKLLSIDQIHNVKLWSNYQHRKRQLKKDLEGMVLPRVHSRLQSCCPWASFDETLNEIIALHGTSEENIQSIVESGFDYRLAREDGLYGQGLYFSDESCKCLQYSRALMAPGVVGCMIVTRLVLGGACFTNGPRYGERIEPLRDPENPGLGRFNSVIACAGIAGNAGQAQVHQEFVVYDGAQACPELVVRFLL